MPAAAPKDLLSDRSVLSRPSIDLVTCLLDFRLEASTDKKIMPRLAAALAACAQLSSLGKLTTISYKNTSKTTLTCSALRMHVTSESIFKCAVSFCGR